MLELNQEPITAFFFFVGLLFGSFANVIIYRLPVGKSIVRPRSQCRSCGKPVAFYDNVPVLSWILLRGKCRHCSASISWRYPLVELITGALFAGAFWIIGWKWFLLEVLILFFGLVVVSFIDFDHQIIPDSFSLPGIVIALAGALLNPERSFWGGLAGVLMGGGFLWAVAYAYWVFRKEEGMGGGDIKLLGWIGGVLGWPAVPFIILLSSIMGSVVGIIVAQFTKKGLKTAIPFGPYIALGAIFYVFEGWQLARWYIDLFFPGISIEMP